MELQKEPQALHLQAVKFSIHRGAARPDLGGANPTETDPSVSAAAREQRCADSRDTERRPVLPGASSAILRDSSRPSRAAPSGRRHSGHSGSAFLSAPPQRGGTRGEGGEPRIPLSGALGERGRGQGRAPLPRMRAQGWRGGLGGRAAPGPGGALRAAVGPGGAGSAAPCGRRH